MGKIGNAIAAAITRLVYAELVLFTKLTVEELEEIERKAKKQAIQKRMGR